MIPFDKSDMLSVSCAFPLLVFHTVFSFFLFFFDLGIGVQHQCSVLMRRAKNRP